MTKTRKEPARVPDWMIWVTCGCAIVGLVAQLQWPRIIAGAMAIWWLIQHFRWHAWDIERRTSEMRREVPRDDR